MLGVHQDADRRKSTNAFKLSCAIAAPDPNPICQAGTDQMGEDGITTDAAIALIISFLISTVLVKLSQTRWRALVRRGDLGVIQSAHSTPTPRLGGLAILAACLVACGLAFLGDASLWLMLALAVAPLFATGAAEDLGFRVLPAARLAAALLASALAVPLTGAWIGETGVAPLDSVFAWTPIAILITIVAAATIAHAFNLIDGLNGLAGFTAAFASLGIAATALLVGDTEIAVMGALLAAATGGFLLVNFPTGKIFLGDAGAYTLGFLLAWMGIALAERSPDVTPIAMVLILFWPLADLSLAIYRRHRRKLPVSFPDRLHFHQLVMRGLEICLLGRGRRSAANPMATIVLLPLIVTPVVMGVLLHGQPLAAAFALVASFVAFFALYGLGMHLATGRFRSSIMSASVARGRNATLADVQPGGSA